MTHVRYLALIALLAVGAISAHAQDSADITINFEVAEVRVIEVGEDTVNLVLDTLDSFGNFQMALDFARFSHIAYNGSNPQKVTVVLDQDMPAGLRLQLSGDVGGESGFVFELSSIEQDWITGIAGPFSGTAFLDFKLRDESGPNITDAQIGSRTCTITMMDE
jgi:hypothetical protein